jgi:hypothetical protein
MLERGLSTATVLVASISYSRLQLNASTAWNLYVNKLERQFVDDDLQI